MVSRLCRSRRQCRLRRLRRPFLMVGGPCGMRRPRHTIITTRPGIRSGNPLLHTGVLALSITLASQVFQGQRSLLGKMRRFRRSFAVNSRGRRSVGAAKCRALWALHPWSHNRISGTARSTRSTPRWLQPSMFR